MKPYKDFMDINSWKSAIVKITDNLQPKVILSTLVLILEWVLGPHYEMLAGDQMSVAERKIVLNQIPTKAELGL